MLIAKWVSEHLSREAGRRGLSGCVVRPGYVLGDSKTGAINAIGSAATHGTGRPEETDQCHDITVYPELGLAAGACAGNGILLDIKDPTNPKRLDAVNDPNYAYWHSASFSNDGKHFALVTLAVDKHRLRVFNSISGRNVAEQIRTLALLVK